MQGFSGLQIDVRNFEVANFIPFPKQYQSAFSQKSIIKGKYSAPIQATYHADTWRVMHL